MALQLGALRDALKEAGASDELARAAAEEVAAYDNRLGGSSSRSRRCACMLIGKLPRCVPR